MADFPDAAIDLSGRRILVTNDDGIHATGLARLERIARTLSDDVWVVAPETEQSGAAHSLTLTQPLRVRRLDDRRFSVRGTPSDCVLMASARLLGERQPDLVLSGVNRGANLGEDVTYSGTVAAAMEGTLLGIPSIAFSQVLSHADHSAKWHTAEHFAPGLIRWLMDCGWPKNVLININFPDAEPAAVAGVEVAAQGRRDVGDLMMEQRKDPRGFPYYWIGFRKTVGPPPSETDLNAARQGRISITPLHLDLTHFETCARLRAALDLYTGSTP